MSGILARAMGLPIDDIDLQELIHRLDTAEDNMKRLVVAVERLVELEEARQQ